MSDSLKTASIGLVLCLFAAIGASSGGVFLRLIGPENEWPVLFLRSVAFSIAVVLYIAMARRPGNPSFSGLQQFRHPSMALAATFLGAAFVFYVIAMNRTTVGNVLLILSMAPFTIALTRRLLFGVQVSLGVWVCMLTGAFGVVVLVVGSASVSLDVGIIYAFIATLCYSGFVICLGSQGRGDFMWAIAAAGVLAAVVSGGIALSLSPGAFMDLGRQGITYAILMGIFQLGVQYILMTRAAAFVAPETISLTLLLEVVLGPLWVWLLFDEAMSRAALVAFPLILGASIANVFVSSSQGRRKTECKGVKP